ncbi:MAG: hypothetical protein NTY08_04660 [Proteobacteria bacterium]|nr:hypothetical protein [Pseudomonadota bacterium]
MMKHYWLHWSRRYWPIFIVLIAVAAIYGRTLGYDFVSWDDDQNITQNPWFQRSDWWKFWTEPFIGMYVPVVYTFWYGLLRLSPPANPIFFHTANVLMHLGNVVLVYAIARRAEEHLNSGSRSFSFAPFIAALVFALHPLQVESVAWVTGLRDLLCCFWVLLATLLSLSSGSSRLRAVCAFLAFIIAVLCKPSAVVLPVILSIISYLGGGATLRKLFIRYLPWVLVSGIVVWLTAHIQTEVISFAVPPLSFAKRLLIAVDSFGFYLSKFVAPFGLAVDYGRTPEKVLGSQSYYLSIACLILLVSLLALSWRKLKATDWGWLLFAGMMMTPTSGIVPFAFQHVSSVADHYAYLPLVGVAIFLGLLVARLPRRLAIGIALVLSVYMTAISLQRVAIWRDDKTLYPVMIAANPDSFAGQIGMLAIAMREERYQDALPYLRNAERIEPTNVVTLLDKWLLYARLGRYQDVVADAPGHILTKEKIIANPNSASTIAAQYVVLAYAQMQLGTLFESLGTVCLARFADPANNDAKNFLPYLGQRLKLTISPEQWCLENEKLWTPYAAK